MTPYERQLAALALRIAAEDVRPGDLVSLGLVKPGEAVELGDERLKWLTIDMMNLAKELEK